MNHLLRILQEYTVKYHSIPLRYSIQSNHLLDKSGVKKVTNRACFALSSSYRVRTSALAVL